MNHNTITFVSVSLLTIGSVMCTSKGSGDDDSGNNGGLDSGVFAQCDVDSDCGDDQTCLDGRCITNGALRFTLQWDDRTDLDLYVATPNGTTIFYGNEAAEGGELDFDDLSGGPDSVENIYFDSSLTSGTYEYWIVNTDFGNASWRLSVHEAGREVDSISGTVTMNDRESQHYQYEYTGGR